MGERAPVSGLDAREAVSPFVTFGMNLTLATTPPDFDDVPDLDDEDLACMDEIAQVLARHGKLGRFDLALAHGHFVLGGDEVLIETNDPVERTLMVRPVRLEDIPPAVQTRETQWQFTDEGPVLSRRCRQACWTTLKDKHVQKHHYVDK